MKNPIEKNKKYITRVESPWEMELEKKKHELKIIMIKLVVKKLKDDEIIKK